ncbi:uncharacterized protein LOC127378407 isoform X2 [Xyrichtys novacula]|uniref:Uncharacterized protein LOC127378407 isoform X2 n=1 Tax=Xyrichtys novacula TaxID=13765 RepID=A0AAV1HR40_XYRNO|nr:uncharacterized protein LOC127378407 isoform X2 [Xyrichtys novacula]
MDQIMLSFLFLLPLCLGLGLREVTVTTEDAVVGKPYVTPVCPTDPNHAPMTIVCLINTKRTKGDTCRLVYHHERPLTNSCGSRFRFLSEFLFLTRLTPEDSGNYTCECTRTDGLFLYHLRIRVTDRFKVDGSLFPTLGVGVTVISFVGGVLMGLICKGKCNGVSSRPANPETPGCKNPQTLGIDEFLFRSDDHENPYTGLQQPASDLYQTIPSVRFQQDTENIEM